MFMSEQKTGILGRVHFNSQMFIAHILTQNCQCDLKNEHSNAIFRLFSILDRSWAVCKCYQVPVLLCVNNDIRCFCLLIHVGQCQVSYLQIILRGMFWCRSSQYLSFTVITKEAVKSRQPRSLDYRV